MPLYREGSLQPVADTGPAPLPLADWLKAPTQAVALANTDQPDELSTHLGRLKLIVLASARARGGESPVSIALFRPGR